LQQTAILIIERCWIAARVIDAWLRSGNRIAEVWCFEPENRLLDPPKGTFGLLFPEWDATRILARNGVPVRLCPPLKTWANADDRISETRADVLMTVMTRQIVPPAILRRFGRRAVNFHPAMLPHYKGPSPRLGMLLDGKADEAGGVTVHVLDPGIDEGAIIARRAVPRSAADSYQHWDMLQAQAAGGLVAGPLLDYLRGRIEATPQSPDEGNYRRVAADELAIGPSIDERQARRLCRILGETGKLSCDGPGESKTAVIGFGRRLGPATGAAPRRGLGYVDTDVKDARLRLRRPTPLSKARTWAGKVKVIRTASEAGVD
jgi:methionyl-tRNA formyltransferase